MQRAHLKRKKQKSTNKAAIFVIRRHVTYKTSLICMCGKVIIKRKEFYISILFKMNNC